MTLLPKQGENTQQKKLQKMTLLPKIEWKYTPLVAMNEWRGKCVVVKRYYSNSSESMKQGTQQK